MPGDEHMAGSPGARESGVARRPDAGLTCLQGLTRVSLERPVSTSRRSSHAPRCHRVRGVGSPSAAWQAVSRRPSRRAAPCRISLCKGCSTTGAGAHSQAAPPPCLRHSQRVPPPSPRWCARPWRPSGWGLRPARRGGSSALPEGSMPPSPGGDARKPVVHTGWVLQRRQSRGRSGSRGTNARESRGSPRSNARWPPPGRAWSRPQVPPARARGGPRGVWAWRASAHRPRRPTWCENRGGQVRFLSWHGFDTPYQCGGAA